MVVYAGQGDPRRSMGLLWREPEAGARVAPGPKPELSVGLVVGTAIEIADAQGLQALSMRAVGERLGRTAMSLYTYVASKNELIDLMYDQAFTELAEEAEQSSEIDEALDWRARTHAWVGLLWRFYLRHPWTLEISQARPVLGPGEFRLHESLATLLHAAGLAPKAIGDVYGSLLNLVRGMVRTAAEARQAQAVTGVPEDEWWYARSEQLEELVPDFSERFPTLALMSADGAFENEDSQEPYIEQEAWETLRFGLEALLDGIQRRIAHES
ncbi:TetR/AcrR family transcriptional regulator [Nocardiopsis sp. MG754419]|uniref:TetR/AcrR family transcriptional regulator n=1 Tax=Nocardiopsis sp. MG754419 TaxID=2259865 RepID=UPI001BAB6386|nr:TetR/AcrR family transcriptional regulator C-terminal domain-containing protein [Nocardiopsis sp. MG754419]MBR8743825.1 TetR/AcrR family transcriptional regulator [Nocardiopsis sp. MG754419]